MMSAVYIECSYKNGWLLLKTGVGSNNCFYDLGKNLRHHES
jgi:hypothetical protein